MKLAQITNPVLGNNLQSLSGTEFFSRLISTLVTFGFVAGSIIFFFMLLMGAIQWINSGGDPKQLEAARGRLTSALIGIVILFAIFAIIKVVEGVFEISILTIDISALKI